MGEQRIDLIESDPLLVPRLQRPYFVIGCKECPAWRSKELQHCQVDFSIAAIDGRIDEDRRATDICVYVAAPQVTMEPRRWLGFTH